MGVKIKGSFKISDGYLYKINYFHNVRHEINNFCRKHFFLKTLFKKLQAFVWSMCVHLYIFTYSPHVLLRFLLPAFLHLFIYFFRSRVALCFSSVCILTNDPKMIPLVAITSVASTRCISYVNLRSVEIAFACRNKRTTKGKRARKSRAS